MGKDIQTSSTKSDSLVLNSLIFLCKSKKKVFYLVSIVQIVTNILHHYILFVQYNTKKLISNKMSNNIVRLLECVSFVVFFRPLVKPLVF